ncbi:uncharacterized protein LOC116927532 [Daphnia magna]|uniref:uncharacterized protein LOC116927532 n=1 Tax=Daphnia magna TaxID=35525 RepID=UPI001E1BC1B3|nr:uncharacterized protein LOC116927532 [Daphnia magna]
MTSPPPVGGELVKYSADQSQTYSTKQPHTIGSQAFPDLSFLTSTPNIDVASQNLIIGEAATTLTDSRFVRCNLASAVYPTQSGVSGVYPTQSVSRAAYPPAKKSAHCAVSQTQPEFKGIKQHLRFIEEKIEGNQLQEVKQVELDEIPLTSVEDYFFQCEVLTNAGKCNALFVKSIGGANGRDVIKIAWSALTKIDCRAHCNVLGIKKGANQKYNLKGTAIVKAVLDGIKLNASIKDITLQEFETSTMSFFVRAPGLIKKRKEKTAFNGSRDSDAGKDDDP